MPCTQRVGRAPLEDDDWRSSMRATLTAKEKTFLDRQRVVTSRRSGATAIHMSLRRRMPTTSASAPFYVSTGRSGHTAENLRSRHSAAVTFDDYSEDWDRLHGVIVRTRARKIERGPEMDERARHWRGSSVSIGGSRSIASSRCGWSESSPHGGSRRRRRERRSTHDAPGSRCVAGRSRRSRRALVTSRTGAEAPQSRRRSAPRSSRPRTPR